MKIELIPLESLTPYINNPRKSLNVDKVAASIKEFGFQQPIVINQIKITTQTIKLLKVNTNMFIYLIRSYLI